MLHNYVTILYYDQLMFSSFSFILGYDYMLLHSSAQQLSVVSTPVHVPALDFILAGSYYGNNDYIRTAIFPNHLNLFGDYFYHFQDLSFALILESLAHERHTPNKLTLSCLQIVLLLSKILLLLLMQLLEFVCEVIFVLEVFRGVMSPLALFPS